MSNTMKRSVQKSFHIADDDMNPRFYPYAQQLPKQAFSLLRHGPFYRVSYPQRMYHQALSVHAEDDKDYHDEPLLFELF